MLFGTHKLDGSSYQAVIDTGSSEIVVPPEIFNSLLNEIERSMKIDCSSNNVFCLF
jgi:predicted aspartyl protease